MIPVCMGEYEIVFIQVLFDKLIAESPDSCSGVNYNDVAAFCPYFDTGCVSAVF